MQDIHILGNGAMGYLWASYFNNTVPVHIITRSTIKNPFNFEKHPEKHPEKQIITSDLTTHIEITRQQKKIHRLIVCTKAFDALAALAELSHLLSDTCQIVMIQNGMGSQQAIADTYPELAIYACSSTEGVYKESDSILMHAGKGENHVGPLTKTATELALQSWLPEHVYKWHGDIQPLLWRKLIVNCAINPLTVVYQCQNGQLLKNASAHDHMAKICAELDTLSMNLNLNLHPTLAIAESVCLSTANNYSSMYQDYKHRRPTEVDYITGYVIRQCADAGIECPENIALAGLIAS
jgi:2-dehydropantoate 2-reductase